MTETTKPTPEQEVLSRFLDELNAGKAPEGDTDETRELLEVASLIRQAELPAAPPRHLVDETIAQVLAEQPQPRKKPRTWLYSGLLGAAASVMLVVGLRLTPVTAPVMPNGEAPAGITAEQSQPLASAPVAIAPANATENAPASASQKAAAVAEQPRAAERQAPLAPSVPVQSAPNAAVAVNPPEKAEAAAPPAAKRPTTASGERSVLAENKGASFPKMMRLELDEPVAVPAPLTLPGHTPATVTKDRLSGQIKQVFYPDTKAELILTQSPLKSGAASAARQVKTDPATGRTSVTLAAGGQQVTLEGFRSAADLLALADTLKPGEKQ